MKEQEQEEGGKRVSARVTTRARRRTKLNLLLARERKYLDNKKTEDGTKEEEKMIGWSARKTEMDEARTIRKKRKCNKLS